MVLGRSIAAVPSQEAGFKVPYGRRGASPVVGSCYVCTTEKRKQRKTRKSCMICVKPVCDEHSLQNTTCISCNIIE